MIAAPVPCPVFTFTRPIGGGALGAVETFYARFEADSSGLFQEATATTPAAATDPVGGAGTLAAASGFFSQYTAGKRPTRQADGAFSLLRFDGVDDYLSQHAALITGQTLPDGSGSLAGKGFTCVGLAWDASRGTWWVANYSLKTDGGGGTIAPSIVEVSADGSTKIQEFLLIPLHAATNVIQGLTLDADGSLWVVSASDGKLLHISTAGALIGTITIAVNDNGVCYAPDLDSFYIVSQSGTFKRVTKAGAVTSLTACPKTNPDHLYYDLDEGLVWLSGGITASRCHLMSYSIARNTWTATTLAPPADAIEGIDLRDGYLWAANDAYYHGGNPALNRLLKTNAPKFHTTTTVSMVMAMKLRSAPAATGTCMVMGEPVADQGLGIFIPALTTTILRVFANTKALTTTERSVGDVVVGSLTSLCVIRLDVDFVAQTATFRRNGVAFTPVPILLCASSFVTGMVTLGAGSALGSAFVTPVDIYDAMAVQTTAEADVVETYLRTKYGV